MKKLLRKCTSFLLTVVMTMSFSMVASADSPTQIYVDGTPGDTILDVPENATNGVVGTLETDADPGDITFFETGADGSSPGNFRFDVDTNGDILLVRDDLINAGASYTLGVEAQEAGGVTIFQDITINITDVPEPPTFENPANFVLLRFEEQGDNGQVFYSENTTMLFDPDADDTTDTLTVAEVSCVDNNTDDCSGLFTPSIEEYDDGFGGTYFRLTIFQPDYDYEDRGGVDFYDITLQATDDGGLSSTETYRITNTNIGETEDVTSLDADQTYGIGDQINIDVNLSDSDTLFYYNQPRDEFFDPLPTVDPTLELQLDSGTSQATLENLPDDTFTGGGINLATGTDENFAGTGPGSPVTFLRFLYTVTEGDSSSDLSYTGTDAIDLGTAEFKDQDFAPDNFVGDYYFETGPGQPVIPTDLPEPGIVGSLSFAKDIVIDGIRPFINNGRGADVETNHQEGDTIEAILELNEDVNKATLDGTSTIDLDIGGVIVTADYDFPLNTTLLDNELGFTYVVTAGLIDEDGVDIVADSFTPNADVFQDLANNSMDDFTHLSFNLPNDLVGVVEEPAPSSGGSGSSSSGSGGSNPFGASNTTPEVEPVEEETAEEQEVTEEPVEEEQTQEEQVTVEPVEEETAEEQPIVTPEPEPQPVEEEQPQEQQVTEEPVEEETAEEQPEEEEAEISFNGSLTTGNGSGGRVNQSQEVEECGDYNSEIEYEESKSYDCDPSEEFIEEDEDAPTIQLNLPRDRQSRYGSDDIVIAGKVSDSSIENVEVIAVIADSEYSLGIAAVDEAGKFLLRNRTSLPLSDDILVYGRDVATPTQSPDYGLAISNSVRLIEANLISFAEKDVNRLYESNEDGVNYWTFVSMNTINNGGLSARVKSELNTNHKALWQSIMFGSSAITGSNSDETVLYAPDETVAEIEPFSRHKVTILAEKANANSVPVVVEYIVLPTGFTPALVILALILLFTAWYLYNKKKGIKDVMESDKAEIEITEEK